MNPAILVGAGVAFAVIVGLLWVVYQIGFAEGKTAGIEETNDTWQQAAAETTGWSCRACWRAAHRGPCKPKWVA